MQREEKLLENSLEATIQRVQDLKNSIASFLVKLETEYQTLNWPSVLDSFALLSSQINSLNRLLKNEKTPQLRNYVLLPLVLSPERDAELEKLTENRVLAFNHEVVPDYLRTKPEPEVEEKQQQIIKQATNWTPDNVQKQINTLNRASSQLVEVLETMRQDFETESKKSTQDDTSSTSDTQLLLSAISTGEGLKPRTAKDSQSSSVSMTSHTQQQEIQARQATPTPTITMQGKAPSSVKTNIKQGSSSHPYSRT